MNSRWDERDAADAFVQALEFLGVPASTDLASSDDAGHDVLLTLPDGRPIAVQIKSTSLVTVDSAPGQIRRWASHLASDTWGAVVADRITAEARSDLDRAGWSWLDLRGHLRLSGPGVFVSADVPVLKRAGVDRSGLRGPVSIELAALLLLDPQEQIGVRAAATTLARAPSSISEAFTALRSADLVADDRKPVVPDLFWELAEHWSPETQDIARLPEPGRGRDNTALQLGLNDVETTVGWALTDTVAAADYGAPVALRSDYPPDFYVPDRAALRRAVKILGPAAGPSSRAGRVHLAPSSLACARRVDAPLRGPQTWPLAHPLFVAMDLARDPGRGREILEAWTPPEPWTRVW